MTRNRHIEAELARLQREAVARQRVIDALLSQLWDAERREIKLQDELWDAVKKVYRLRSVGWVRRNHPDIYSQIVDSEND